jgi:hypothetical protein
MDLKIARSVIKMLSGDTSMASEGCSARLALPKSAAGFQA